MFRHRPRAKGDGGTAPSASVSQEGLVGKTIHGVHPRETGGTQASPSAPPGETAEGEREGASEEQEEAAADCQESVVCGFGKRVLWCYFVCITTNCKCREAASG